MSTKSLAQWGWALVFPVLGVVGWAHALPTRGKLDRVPDAKQGPELAAAVSLAPTANRDAGDHAPTVGETYPFDRTQSPLTPAVAASLRAIAARNGRLLPNTFAKLGASATVNHNYLYCFAGPFVNLAGNERLQSTIDHFNGGDPGEGWRNPFRRRSLSATVGWHAGRAIWGDPPPLTREVRVMDPRFAVVMYGTNDIELGRPAQYARLMLRLTRMLTRRGVIPIMTTIMPRDDDPEADRVVSLYNAVVRGIAQARSLPMTDLHRELVRLPNHGLASDRLHPSAYRVDGSPRPCDFGPEGLRHGYNIRNLITLRALDRVRRVLLEGEAPPDRSAPGPRGAGSIADPIRITQLPFSSMGDTARSVHRTIDRYEGCGAQDESGPEIVYRLRLEARAAVQAMVVTEGEVDVDIHHLRREAGARRCDARSDEALSLELEAGEHWFAVDTFVDGARGEHPGRYLFVIARTDRPSDPARQRVDSSPERPLAGGNDALDQ